MENKVSPVNQSSTMLSPKNVQSPTKRQILKEISQNTNASQISNGDSKLSNATPASHSSTLKVTPNQVSLSKSSDESSDSSLDYGSANEDSANRDDSLIHAFNDFHLNTPKADGNNLREKVLITPLDGSVKFEANSSLGSDSPKYADQLDSQISEHSSRTQKIFNIVTECFETPDSSLIADQTLTISKENLEIGQDPLHISDVGTFNLALPTIDPILEKSESVVGNSPVPNANDSGVHVLSESFTTNKAINNTFDVCDAEGIAVISAQCPENKPNDERECSPDPVISNHSETVSKSFSGSIDSISNIGNPIHDVVSHNESCIPHETSHAECNSDNLDTISNDGIVVLKCNVEEENDNDLKSGGLDIVQNPSEINPCDIHIESLEETQHIDATNNSHNSLVEKNQISTTSDIANELHELGHNTKTEVCLSTTFEIPPNVENPNTTFSEPMDCDVSFVGHVSEHVIHPADVFSPSKNEPNDVLNTFGTHHLPPDNLIISETAQPVVANQSHNQNIDDSEPMDCDDVIEADLTLQNIPQASIESSIVDVNIANGPIHEDLTSKNTNYDISASTQVVESHTTNDNDIKIDVNISDDPKTVLEGVDNINGVDTNFAIGDSALISHTFEQINTSAVNIAAESGDNSESVSVHSKQSAVESTKVEIVNEETAVSLTEIITNEQSASDTISNNNPDSIRSPDAITEPTIVSEEISVEDTNPASSLQPVEISNIASFENDKNSSEIINIPGAVVSGEIRGKDINVSESLQKTEVSKVAGFDESEVNPFATRSRILNTPDRDACSLSVSNHVTPVSTPVISIAQPESDQENVEVTSTSYTEFPSPNKQFAKKEIQDLPINISNISEEEIPPMVFNDAEVINDEVSAEKSPEKIDEINKFTEMSSNKMENIAIDLSQVNIALESDNLQSLADDCLDEEFKRPLVLQSELMNTDLDGLESDSDTMSVCSLGNPSDINPFETRCKIANSPEKDVDKTLTLNSNELNDNFESASNATLVDRNSINRMNSVSLVNNSLSYDKEANVVSPDIVVGTKENPKSPASSIHLSETIVVSDSPEITKGFQSSLAFKDHVLRKCEKSPDYNENTPKTAKPAKKIEEGETKEHVFVSPLAHDRRVKELAKRKIADKKVSNLSPMSRCGDLMGLSPVSHTEGECTNRFDQVSDEAFTRDPFFCDDLEEDFKMPANFIKDPLDFLLSCGSNASNQYQCKESLLLKFDPLLSSGRGGLPTGVRPGRETIPESPRVEEDASTASGLAESCSSDSSPLSTSITEGKTFGKMSSMDQSLGAPSPKVVNVTPQPVEKPTQVVTPAISTRQPVTPISSKNNPVTPAKSVTSAIAAIDRLISLGGTPPPPPVVVQPKEPEMDPRMLAELQSVRELLARQEEELRKTEEQKQGLESQLADAVSREQTLIERLNDKKMDRRQMDTVLEEYERTMTQFIGERDVEKRQWEEERASLMRERDEANAHLANMEHSFNDIHAKYERCKVMIQGYKANEEVLKETVRSNDEASKKQLERYEHLRQHAMSQLEIANQEIDSVKKSSQAEIIKLQAMLKKSEINATSLQESLAQKTKDIEELTAICDELIQKVG